MRTKYVVAGQRVHSSVTTTGKMQYWITLPGGNTSAAASVEELRLRHEPKGDRMTTQFADGISLKEAGKLTGYSTSWITARARLGDFAVARVGGQGRIAAVSKGELEAFIKKHQATNPAQRKPNNGSPGHRKRRWPKRPVGSPNWNQEQAAIRNGKGPVRTPAGRWAVGRKSDAWGMVEITLNGKSVAFMKPEYAVRMVEAMNLLGGFRS